MNMKKYLLFIVFGVAVFSLHGAVSKMYSSMRHDLRRILLGLIEHERAAILAAQFLITDEAFVHALRNVVERGVPVEMVVDKACFSKWGKGKALQDAGVVLHVYDGKENGIMHEKVWIFHENESLDPEKAVKILAHGSYNPTLNASKKNLEMLHVLSRPKKVIDECEDHLLALRDAVADGWTRS